MASRTVAAVWSVTSASAPLTSEVGPAPTLAQI